MSGISVIFMVFGKFMKVNKCMYMINNEKKQVTEPAVEMGLNPFTKDCLLAPSDYPTHTTRAPDIPHFLEDVL